jgi:hypothetical protein
MFSISHQRYCQEIDEHGNQSFYLVLFFLWEPPVHATDTNSLSLANFVGSVVGFFNVCTIRLRRLLLAASLSFESETV